MADAAVVTGIGLVCPHAASVEELVSGTRAPAAAGDWFEPERYLGRRGFKYLTPATRYVLAAAGLALDDAGVGAGAYEPADAGVVVGTNFGVSSVLERMDRVVIGEGAGALSPMDAPNFSVNIAASHVSMKHAFRAFNVSLTNAVVAGIEALVLAAHFVRRGRARMTLAGATEDRVPEDGAAALGAPAGGAGACALLVEDARAASERGARAYASVAGGASRFVPPGAGERTVRRVVDDALAAAGEGAAGRVALCAPPDGFELGRAAGDALRAALTRRGAEISERSYAGARGDYATVSPLLQAAGVAAQEGAGVVAAASPHGHVAVAVLERA